MTQNETALAFLIGGVGVAWIWQLITHFRTKQKLWDLQISVQVARDQLDEIEELNRELIYECRMADGDDYFEIYSMAMRARDTLNRVMWPKKPE